MDVASYDPTMTQSEINQLNTRVDSFNTGIRAQNQGSKNTLEEADFLNLLVTQLRNQDPTDPVKDKEFIGQMTQFTNLKQMSKMSESMVQFVKEFSFTKAVAMVNKQVSWTDDSGRLQSGIVDSIKVREGDTFLNVGGTEVRLDQVSEVRAADVGAGA